MIIQIFALLLCHSSASVCLAEEIRAIPDEARVTLKRKNDRVSYEQIWVSSKEETEIALNAVVSLLKNRELHKEMADWSRRNIETVYRNLSKFRVQFVGVVDGSDKKILCNFILATRNHPEWQKEFIMVIDGGW